MARLWTLPTPVVPDAAVADRLAGAASGLLLDNVLIPRVSTRAAFAPLHSTDVVAADCSKYSADVAAECRDVGAAVDNVDVTEGPRVSTRRPVVQALALAEDSWPTLVSDDGALLADTSIDADNVDPGEILHGTRLRIGLASVPRDPSRAARGGADRPTGGGGVHGGRGVSSGTQNGRSELHAGM
jgi:hypothetical protein